MINKILGEYQNGNYHVTILSDGTKIRENDLDYFDAEFPESMDLKITNRCHNNCPFCHEDSSCNGKHGDILSPSFIDNLKPYTEIACLSGDTIVHGENGSIEIKNLKIGDAIYDSEHKLRKIINIKTSNEDCYQIKGYRGIDIISSKNHPFIVSGKQTKAIDLINKTIDQLNCIEDMNQEYVIDMSSHIRYADENKKSSRGGKILCDGRIMLRHDTAPIPRYVHLTPELMWAYGLYVAEGDKRCYTLNINEQEMAKRVGRVWVDTFNSSYYTININKDSNSLNLLLSPQTLLQELFVNEMKSGKGARNKNLGYLYHINNKELVRWALIGLIDGDGCFRRRKGRKANNMYSVSLKTSSKHLAYDFSYLLMKWFGIKTSVYHGMNPERKIENRILKPSDYYMVDFYGYEDCKKLFGDYYGELIPTVEDYKRNHNNITSIKRTDNEILYDITLDGGTHIFPINGYWLTHNCGGGDPLEHPDLIPFLHKLKKLKMIPSMTIRQNDFEDNLDLLRKLRDEELIYGLGISLINPTDEFISKVKEFPNAVIHVINGIVTLKQMQALAYNNLKILILGYKDFRRGAKLLTDSIERSRIEFLMCCMGGMWIPHYIKNKAFDVISFDNLAIKQINPQRYIDQDEWKSLYMGDDGIDGKMTSASMYVDMVERKFARNSCSNDRFELMDNIVDMYNFLKEMC